MLLGVNSNQAQLADKCDTLDHREQFVQDNEFHYLIF